MEKISIFVAKKEMTQKEAIIEALNCLGGKASLNDIYRFAYKLADFSGSKDWKATIRWYLQKETNSFRSTKRGSWELVSYQEELAKRDLRIKELMEENELLKAVKTEDDFVERFVEETKRFYKHERKKADAIRQIMIKVGRQDAEAEIDAWMDGKQTKVVKKVEKKIVQKISNSQVFNGSITNSEFNGGGTDHEG